MAIVLATLFGAGLFVGVRCVRRREEFKDPFQNTFGVDCLSHCPATNVYVRSVL